MVYADVAQPDGGLAILDLTTGTSTPIAGTGDHAYDPAVSPNGREIAYRHDGDLWTIPVGGGVARRVTTTPDVDEYQPAWWSDGDRLAFALQLADGSLASRVAVLSLSLGQPVSVDCAAPPVSEPSIAPDGSIACTQGSGPSRTYAVVLAHDPFAPGEPSRFTGPAGSGNPDWSPDGQLLAYELERQGGTFIAVGAPGQSPTVIGGEALRQPDWSPDGRAIVAVRESGGLARVAIGADGIWGSADDDLQLLPGGAGSGRIAPSWVPDGTASMAPTPTPTPAPGSGGQVQVGGAPSAPAPPPATAPGRIFFAAQGTENLDIFSVSPAGDRPRRLTENLGDDTDPDVSPWLPGREQRVIWAYRSRTLSQLRWMRPDGTGQGLYPMRAPVGFQVSEPSWLPDGSGVVFVGRPRGATRTSIWIVRQGGAPVQLTPAVDRQRRQTMDRSPAVSPDGTRVVFRRTTDTGAPGLCVMGIAGGTPTCTVDDEYVTLLRPDSCATPRDCLSIGSQLLERFARGVPSWAGQEVWSTAGLDVRGSDLVLRLGPQDAQTVRPLEYSVYADDAQLSRWPVSPRREQQEVPVAMLQPVYPREIAPRVPLYALPSPDGTQILSLTAWSEGRRSGEQLTLTSRQGPRPVGGPITDRLPVIGLPSWQSLPATSATPSAPLVAFGDRVDVRAQRSAGGVGLVNGEAFGIEVEFRERGGQAARAATTCTGSIVLRRFVAAGARQRITVPRAIARRPICVTVRSAAGERRAIALRRSP